jgi:hypothetical protein
MTAGTAAEAPLTGMIEALDVEIDTLRKQGGGTQIQLRDGERTSEVAGRWLYRFVVLEDLKLRDEPAIETDCKCQAVRVDVVEHNEKVCDRILAETRKAQFVVADFSMHRQNVYFEAGFAFGLGRPVIWMCRKEDFDDAKMYFDTRQYNHIVWDTSADLRVKLRNRSNHFEVRSASLWAVPYPTSRGALCSTQTGSRAAAGPVEC